MNKSLTSRYTTMSLFAFIPSLVDARLRLKRAAKEITETFELRRPAVTDQVTPGQLSEALEQFMAVIVRLDQEEGETGPIYKDDVSQLGEYGLSLLTDMTTWAAQLELEKPKKELETITLAATSWIIRHDGEVRSLEPLVNALANLANRTHDASTLEQMAVFMGQIIQATSAFIKQDLEKNNPGRPWRLLHLNRGIVATRSHNPAVMEQAFEDLVRALPEEAATFFAEGMQQMEALNYPSHVRQIMGRYFDKWTRPRMH